MRKKEREVKIAPEFDPATMNIRKLGDALARLLTNAAPQWMLL